MSRSVCLSVRPSVFSFCLYTFFSLSACLLRQCLERKSDDNDDPGGLASRTRSKLPLVDVPLVQLEAELLPPDTTADMYEQSAAMEDRHWTAWLQGLVALDNEGAPGVKSKATTSRWRSAFSALSVSFWQRREKTRTTQSTTSWTTWTSRTWRIIAPTGLSRSPVGSRTRYWSDSEGAGPQH